MKPRTSARRPAHSNTGATFRSRATRQCTSLAQEQAARQEIGPPWHLVGSAQYGVGFAIRPAEAAALYGREHVAFEKDAFGPLR
jgi:hypothetical protein